MVSGVEPDDRGRLGRDQLVGAGDRHDGQDGQAEGAATCWDALNSPAARPALSPGTPALAAAATDTNTDPAPRDITRNPGSKSPTYEPCSGTRDRE